MCKSQHTVSSYCWLMATITFITKKKGVEVEQVAQCPGPSAAPPGQTKPDDVTTGRNAVQLAEAEPSGAPAGKAPPSEVKDGALQPR